MHAVQGLGGKSSSEAWIEGHRVQDRPVQEGEHERRDDHAHDRERLGLDVLWVMYYACSWYHCSVAIRTHFLHFAFKTLGSATRNGAMNTELVVVACLFDSCERRLR